MESTLKVPVVVIVPPVKPYKVATLVTVPFPLASILDDNEAVSVVFNLLANLEVRFNKDVSVNSIKTLRSAETVPVVVIGSGETRIPVPPDIDVKLPDPPPLPAPPPRGKITV